MNNYHIDVSEYYELYEDDLKKILLDIQQVGKENYSNQELSSRICEANKCLKQMESELVSLPQSLKNQCSQQIAAYRVQYNYLNSQIPPKPTKSSKSKYYDEQQIGLLNSGNNMLENGELINDMERLANETEFIAGNVNTTLSAGTRALTNAKAHRSELKSNLKKAELSVNMLNRKVVVSKLAMYIIVTLLAIIDILALYLKLS